MLMYNTRSLNLNLVYRLMFYFSTDRPGDLCTRLKHDDYLFYSLAHLCTGIHKYVQYRDLQRFCDKIMTSNSCYYIVEWTFLHSKVHCNTPSLLTLLQQTNSTKIFPSLIAKCLIGRLSIISRRFHLQFLQKMLDNWTPFEFVYVLIKQYFSLLTYFCIIFCKICQ